ncbi:MAG TPA: DegT/DnrJ/EryC1/StrS family aminotransferase, partial [Candidatus Eremiobacteraceae bacterium]|nr:DegT/DnrJ/EryC1/StrS family aminotransferase [Candidatus Eremiobacteraceae bacterium]
RFRARSGLPVVIDAAAGFDAVTPGAIPVVVSLHATKIFGVGEGGFVMSTDLALVRDVRARSNFGFAGTREARTPAVNAKLSEYHAAVGLAALDEWPEVRSKWIEVAQAYRRALAESNLLRFQDGFGQSWIAATCVLQLANSGANQLESALAEAGIETRRWWGGGAHRHAATAAYPRTPLPVTEALANSTVAIPFFRDLDPGDMHQVAKCVLASGQALDLR